MRDVLIWLILIVNLITLCLICNKSKKENFAEYGSGYFIYPCYQNGDCPNNMRCVQDKMNPNTHGLCSPY